MSDDDRPRWNDVSGVENDVREALEPMLRPDAFQRPRADAAADVLESVLNDR